MRYATAEAFRTAIERRLLSTSREQAVPLSRLRKLVVFDRLLARLMVVGPDRWMLKGAVALDFRYGSRVRTTKDLDLGCGEIEIVATSDLFAAQDIDLDDYFSFIISRTDALDEALEGAAVRYRVRAELANRRFEEVIVDVGFDGIAPMVTDIVSGPELLRFAGFEPVRVPTITIQQHIAEKLHAYTHVYAGDRQSTRVKDLVDLVLIRMLAEVHAGELRLALERTFQKRGRHTIPRQLPSPPPMWELRYPPMADAVGLSPNIRDGYEAAADFLNPVLSGSVTNETTWDPRHQAWLPKD